MSDLFVEDISRDAWISDCGQYRYELTRSWKAYTEKSLIFVMLNPSTADAHIDDPTIRRCMNFAKREGFGMMTVMNLFAGRATKPTDLFKMDDPVGPENVLRWKSARSHVLDWGGKIVCAWGAHPKASQQVEAFLQVMSDTPLHCLGTTKDGQPRHPLYLRNDAPLTLWEPTS